MDMTTKLILVEGLPGSGKTTTAVFVADWLKEHGMETAVFLEGSLDHPADFESVACSNPHPTIPTPLPDMPHNWFVAARYNPEHNFG